MSTMRVDNITEKTSGAGVKIPGHIMQVVNSNTNSEFAFTSANTWVNTGLV